MYVQLTCGVLCVYECVCSVCVVCECGVNVSVCEYAVYVWCVSVV